LDNLTHSLVGAVLGQVGLKKKTGLGMATLIIGANLPDIDAIASVLGVGSLSLRRGLTHGPIALFLLPILLTWAMIAFDNWQAKRGTRPADRLPIHKGWLLALAYIGTISHPLFDLLNNYGVRLLEPFSSQWFYGDSIFIIDIWMWAAMIGGIWLSRKWEKRGKTNWRNPAFATFLAIGFYVAANGLITNHAEAKTTVAVTEKFGVKPDLVIANPRPVVFWQREMIWRGKGKIGKGWYNGLNFGGSLKLNVSASPNNMTDPAIRTAQKSSGDMASFLFWSRIPFAKVEKNASGKYVTMRDARFMEWPVADRFLVRTKLKAPEPK